MARSDGPVEELMRYLQLYAVHALQRVLLEQTLVMASRKKSLTLYVFLLFRFSQCGKTSHVK